MQSTANKDIDYKLRLDSVTAELVEKACAYANTKKSEFFRRSAREKAELIISEHEKTHFSSEDWSMFFDMVETTPEPTERMKQARSKYEEITG